MTVHDRTIGTVREVAEITYGCRAIEVPSDATDVRVGPLSAVGATRVTYLQPLRPVAIRDRDPSPVYIY